MDEKLYHCSDGGELEEIEIAHYGYFDAPLYQCKLCGIEIEVANLPDEICTEKKIKAQ